MVLGCTRVPWHIMIKNVRGDIFILALLERDYCLHIKETVYFHCIFFNKKDSYAKEQWFSSINVL